MLVEQLVDQNKVILEYGSEMPKMSARLASVEQAVDELVADVKLSKVVIKEDGARLDQLSPGVRERASEMRLNLLRRAHELEQGQPQLLEPPALGRLGEVHCPTLVVVGDEDIPPILATADLLATAIKGARKVMIHDTAHLPNIERPAEFNQLVLAFLASVGW